MKQETHDKVKYRHDMWYREGEGHQLSMWHKIQDKNTHRQRLKL